MSKKVYVVNYKETTIDEDNVLNTESGICDYGYKNEQDAIKKVSELVEEKKEECVDELGYEEEDVEITLSENADYQTVSCGSNTFDYWVSILVIV